MLNFVLGSFALVCGYCQFSALCGVLRKKTFIAWNIYKVSISTGLKWHLPWNLHTTFQHPKMIAGDKLRKRNLSMTCCWRCAPLFLWIW